MKNVYDTLQERGFIEQVTDEIIRDVLETEEVACYIGFDPTATSLHVGSLVPIMSLAHMQRPVIFSAALFQKVIILS